MRGKKTKRTGIKVSNRVVVAAMIATMVILKVIDLSAGVFLSIGIGLVIGLILFAGGEALMKIGATLITITFISLYAAHGHGNAARSRDRPECAHIHKVHHHVDQGRCHGKTTR